MKTRSRPGGPRGDAKARRRTLIAEAVQSLHLIFRTVDLFSRETLGRFGVTGPQIWALRTIEEAEVLTVGALSERMFLHISTVSGILDRLESAGLVDRERLKADRRVVQLRLTPQGRSLIRRAPEPPRMKVLRGLKRLPTRQVAAVRSAILRLAEIMGAEADPSAAS
jgi:DNA-binding MarR family transcriptional regulator